MSYITLEHRIITYKNYPTPFSHSYLVFHEDDGTEWVISAYVPGRDFRNNGLPFETVIAEKLALSPEARHLTTGVISRVLDLPDGISPELAWKKLAQYAREIDQSEFGYDIFDRNSNSFTAALLFSIEVNPLSAVSVFELPSLLAWTNYDDLIAFVPPSRSADVLGTDAGDILSGTHLPETLYGYSGADFIAGRGGNDLMIGGGHGDAYSVGRGEGSDTIDDRGGGGSDTLRLFVTGSIATTINLDWFTPDGNDLLVRIPKATGGGYEIDIRIENMGSSSGQIEWVELFLGDAEDESDRENLVTIWQEKTRSPPPDQPDPTDPDDTPDPDEPPSSVFTWIGTSAANTFNGTSGEDVVAGLGGDDDLSGQGDDDTLMGNSGEDTLNGGTGDDLLIDDDPGSLFADNLIGGSGNDTLVFYGAPSGETDTGDGGSGRDMAYVDLSDSTRDWDLTENDGDIWIRLDSGSSVGDIELENFEVIAVFFGSGDDFAHSGDNQQAYFEGGGGNDQIITEDENDYLDGGSGDDRLDAGTGVDWIDGGSGNDRAEVDLSGESRDLTYVADYAEDDDGFTFENGTHIRDIERIELVTGSGDDRIWLGDDDDDVTTGSGDDAIYTDLEAHDSVDGGSGRDRLVVDRSDSDEQLRSSYDTSDDDFEISLEEQYSSAEHRLHASDIEELVLFGGSANDLLRGGDGDDELIGNGGDDNIRGNDGDDRLEGGAGDDELYIGNGADWADGGSGEDFGSLDKTDLDLDFRFDTRFAGTASGFALADGTFVRSIERWFVRFGDGNDTVTTWLRGRQDFNLGAGENKVIVDHRNESTALTAGPGVDAGGAAYLVYVGPSFDTATERLSIEDLTSVSIYGGLAADTISGGAGNDVLSGEGGADTMSGGAGDDAYFVDNVLDRVVEAVGGGRDTIFAGISYVLPADVEVEVLSTDNHAGSAAINLTGNAGNQEIFGNSGANVLDGGTGDDSLLGRAGHDSYFVDSDGDRVFELAGEGSDRVFASVSYALALVADVEMLTTTDSSGTAAIDLTGSNTANFIYANNGANSLSGRDGSDFLVGLGGNDLLDGGAGNDITDGGTGEDWHFVDSAGDSVTERAGEGSDRVFASVSYALTLTADVEMLTTTDSTGTAAIDLTGSDTANFIYANAGANSLSGRDGSDFLVGLSGNDRLDGGAGNDITDGGTGDDWHFVDSAGDSVTERLAEGGNDRVFAATSYALGADAEVEMLTTADNAGVALIHLTGNGFANFLYGNDGVNALFGLAGDDVLASRAGNDILDGGAGRDHMIGGSGADAFRFTAALGAANVDVVTDFELGVDKIALLSTIFPGLAYGTLAGSAFRAGTSAQDADDRILYDAATGALFFDADGNGAGAALHFATLQNAPLNLAAADFTVI